MNITNMDISDYENEEEDDENWSCPEDNENSKKIKNSNLLSSIFQSPYSDSEEEDTNVTLSPENHSRNKNNDIDMINISSDDEQDEQDVQSAIMYSLRTLAQEKDKKQKSVVTPCTLTPVSFSTLGGTREMGSTSSPRTCFLCRDVVCSPNRPIVTLPCHHLFCDGCLSRYVGEKVNEGLGQVACPVPKCCTVFYGNFIMGFVPTEVKDRWLLAMHEGSVLNYTMWYKCPLEGCKRNYVDDERNYQIRACTCCWRLICTKCSAGWHMGMTCQQFEKREEEAKRRIMMIKERREEERRLREEQESERKLKQWLKETEGQVINSGFGSTLLPILNHISFIMEHED